jgi:hypothetical protein
MKNLRTNQNFEKDTERDWNMRSSGTCATTGTSKLSDTSMKVGLFPNYVQKLDAKYLQA